MRRALVNSVYRRLFIAQIVALAGTGLATVALALVAYDLDPGRAGGVLGTALAVKMVAYVLVAPVATAALAHLPRRTVLVAADVVRLGAALCLPWVDAAWQVYVLVAVLQVASATFTPTFQSVVPDVLDDEDDFTAALSLSRLAYDLESIFSPVLAAALLLVVRPGDLFLGTAVGFAVSAVIVVRTVIPARVDVPDEAPLLRRATRGAEVMVRTSALRPVLALNLAVAGVGAFVIVQTVVVVRTVLGFGEELVPLILGAQGAGSILLALVLGPVVRAWGERATMLGGATLVVLAGAAVPLVLLADGMVALVGIALAWFVVGAGWSATETPVGRLVRRHAPPERLPDVFAAQFSLSHACWLLTYPLAGWLGTVSIDGAAFALAAVSAAGLVVAAATWPRNVSAQATSTVDTPPGTDLPTSSPST
ncbi:MFS transporter [Sanguibacter sp. A247]|uniref:MFS transporter n=1 Tax=unclassified Sanguibacter TaxID=2645534 RepID=UPI003FD6F261